MARSRLTRSWLREGATVTALFSGLLTGIPAFLFTYIIWPLPVALVWAAGSGLVGAAISGNHYRKRVRQRLYNHFREKFGERETFPCEVEMTEAGLSIKQMGAQILFEWPNVEEMQETEDAIEFYVYGGGGLLVKKRFFSSTEEMQQFIDAARRHLNASRTSSNWLHASEY